jgi:hypothetical protein
MASRSRGSSRPRARAMSRPQLELIVQASGTSQRAERDPRPALLAPASSFYCRYFFLCVFLWLFFFLVTVLIHLFCLFCWYPFWHVRRDVFVGIAAF